MKKAIDRIIDQFHKKLVDVEASTNGNGNTSNNPNHPANWTEQQYFDYAEKWVREFARVVKYRDSDKTSRSYKDNKDLIEKLSSLDFEEEFLQLCVRYQTQIDKLDNWFNYTPAERYNKEKKSWVNHVCSCLQRYGNSSPMPDKWGCHGSPISGESICVPECRYYEKYGTLEDDEILSWYSELGDRTYEQLKDENTRFIQWFVKTIKRQANELPANIIATDYYYLSIDHLSVNS